MKFHMVFKHDMKVIAKPLTLCINFACETKLHGSGGPFTIIAF
jgi:hypothetical protein